MQAVEPAHSGLGASPRAVQHHYDLGNAFYSLWLDPTLTYSCALWEDGGGEGLQQAQERKLDFHIAQARAHGAARVLDIGCGWGSLLRRLVEHAGVQHAVGLTLSEAQAERIRGADDPRIGVSVQGWQDHVPRAPYGAIVSIGAFEHFARPGLAGAEVVEAYRRFFAKCHEWLLPGAWLSLQTIAYGTARRKDLNRFIIEHIFPESDLPRLSDIALAADGLFELVALRNDRLHYAATLKHWYFNLRASRARAVALVGARTVADYEKYLSLFMVGFHTGAMSLIRAAFRRVEGPRPA